MLAPPDVHDTLIKISGHTLLVTGYYDARLETNPNLERNFPLIPWRGEIAVLFLGKRRHFLARGPPESVIFHALAMCVLSTAWNTRPPDPLCRYMGVCLNNAQRGVAFPAHMNITFVTFHPDNLAADAIITCQ